MARASTILGSSGADGLSALSARIARLSDRERQVVRLLRAGTPQKALGRLLVPAVKESTAREYVKRAYAKLEVTSRYQLPRV